MNEVLWLKINGMLLVTPVVIFQETIVYIAYYEGPK